MSKSRSVGAFSLVELLVVVSIIVLLIAILIPTLSYARRAARISQTASTIGNIVNALEAYRSDHRQYPRTSTNNGGSPGMYGFNALAQALCNKNQGFRLVAEGRQYGPYLQATATNFKVFANRADMPNSGYVLATGSSELNANNMGFIDAWGQPIFYWLGNSLTGAQGQTAQDLFSYINDASQNNRSYLFQDNNPSTDSGVSYTVAGQTVNSRLVPYTPAGVWDVNTTPWGGTVHMDGDKGNSNESATAPANPRPGLAFRQKLGMSNPSSPLAGNSDRILGRTSFLISSAGADNQYYTADDVLSESRQ